MPSTEAPAETHEVETVHGSVEYETVTCSNCRHELQPAEALPVGIGLEATDDHFIGDQTRTAYTAAEVRHLCTHCAESTLGYDGPPGRFETLTETITSLSTLERALLALGSLALVGLFVLNLAVLV
ncbi:hypothetical protein SAMN04487949_1703 [Halogranum gelatinilyticum]|uniref:Uncharacterized protein n=1 Tax=Halogranum gelatinilyticum TaxID=660521 RepID=A0A1G9TB99_9EURY|nr:hypothetical protein [Halogranum gelatinilyticum]SDM44983.1 hypothetical protein SAMN04487949_1703 [Halogranum gelatinilyticum]